MTKVLMILLLTVVLTGCGSMSDDMGTTDGGRDAPVIQVSEVDPD